MKEIRRPESDEKYKWLSLHITNCQKPRRTYLSGRISYKPDVRYQMIQVTKVESEDHEAIIEKIMAKAS